MEVIRGLENLVESRPSAVTIGAYDGLHLGHKKIIDTLLEKSSEFDAISTVLSFEPHPKLYLANKNNIKNAELLHTPAEKLLLLEQFGVERIVILEFDQNIANYDYIAFVKEILLQKLNMKYLVIGHDHAFGKGREGNHSNLSKLARKEGFGLTRVTPHSREDEVINSTMIRNYLKIGKVRVASLFLGYRYSISGKVVHGDGRGKTLSFPTANIQPDNKHKIIPMNGVYAVDVVVLNQRYKAMMNIGFRPTFNTRSHAMEVNIFGMNKDIYGETITVYFKKRLRKEQKFSSEEELISQLKKDKEKSLLL